VTQALGGGQSGRSKELHPRSSNKKSRATTACGGNTHGKATARRENNFLELKSGASWSWLVVHDRFGVRDRAALAGVRGRVWLTG
jgi:hypothetical protein